MIRRTAALIGFLAIAGLAVPAHAQTAENDFSYSPDTQVRGKTISVTGQCVDTEELAVSVQEGADGNGSFVFSKTFPAETGAKISGSITVPDDAPFGSYVITAVCRTGSYQPFTENGPFAVVDKIGATTTTTAAPKATTTSSSTSTTVEDTGPTTTAYKPTELQTDVDSATETTISDETTTTVDEFAASRKDDDDSIGPLLLVIGAVPLVLAVGAIALAMRRRGATSAE